MYSTLPTCVRLESSRSALGMDHCRDLGDDLGIDLGDDLGIDLGIDLGRDLGIDFVTDLGDELCMDLGDNLGADLGDDLGVDFGEMVVEHTFLPEGFVTLRTAVWPVLTVYLTMEPQGVCIRAHLATNLALVG
jgi:hypothetical protein